VGRRLARRVGPIGFLARDIADEVPNILRAVDAGQDRSQQNPAMKRRPERPERVRTYACAVAEAGGSKPRIARTATAPEKSSAASVAADRSYGSQSLAERVGAAKQAHATPSFVLERK